MKVTQPILKRGRDVWDSVNLPLIEFEQRIVKIRNSMLQNGIDILLLYGNGIDKCGYPCYVTNYAPTMPGGVIAMLTLEREACEIFAEISSRDLSHAKQTTSTGNVRACQNVADSCISYLKENKLIPATIGLAGLEETMPYGQYRSMQRDFGASQLVNFEHFMDQAIMIKSSREHDRIRRAGSIISRVYEFVQNARFTDSNELNVEAALERTAFLEGAEDCRVLLAGSSGNDPLPRPADDMQILSGQNITIYLAVRYERYWAEAIRTLQFSDHYFKKNVNGTMEDIYSQIIELIKPGKKSSELFDEITAGQTGGSYRFIPGFELGGGIGLSLRELPFIHSKDTTFLRQGMVLTLRITAEIPTLGTAIMGNTLCLTENRPELLTG